MNARYYLSGRRVKVADDQEVPLKVGDLVTEKIDIDRGNASYLGVVTNIREGEVLNVTVKWLKWGPDSNPDNWSSAYRSTTLYRLEKLP